MRFKPHSNRKEDESRIKSKDIALCSSLQWRFWDHARKNSIRRQIAGEHHPVIFRKRGLLFPLAGEIAALPLGQLLLKLLLIHWAAPLRRGRRVSSAKGNAHSDYSSANEGNTKRN